MEKILRYIVNGLLVTASLAIVLYLVFVYVIGYNFVHSDAITLGGGAINGSDSSFRKPGIAFTTGFRGGKFDSLLDSFLKKNPQYASTDTSFSPGYNDTCHCDCLPFTRILYFNSTPKEAYQITYDADTTKTGFAGVLDIVFVYKNSKWGCEKAFNFDSAQKKRILCRLDTAVLEKLKVR